MTDSNSNKKFEPVFWKDFVGGYVAGIVNVLAGQPFDICKIRIQTLGQGSLPSVFKEIITNEGIGSLWKGSAFPLLCFGLCSSLMFPIKEKCNYYFMKLNNGESLKYWQLFIAGGIGGLSQGFISSPMEHIRIRMQIQTKEFKPYNNSLDCVSKILKEHGVKGLYKGFTLTMMREFFLYGAYFGVYDTLRENGPSGNVLYLLLIGGLGGMAAWTHGALIDNLKSKMQVDDFVNPKYKSLMDLKPEIKFDKITKGFSTGLIRAFPVNVCTFFSYELSKKALYPELK